MLKPVTYTDLFIQDCDKYFPGQNYRCSTCNLSSGVINICTDPSAGTGSACDPSSGFSNRCSCGQLYPEPQRIWPLNERDQFINEHGMGDQKKGDAGNSLVQPVAAANEADFTGFKDQIADSAQAGLIPGNGDWTV